MSETTREREALAAVARLFGELLLLEIDEAALGRLQRPEIRAALEGLDVVVPDGEGSAFIDDLAADFYARFLQPKQGGPLVQSLWTGGGYDSESAAMVRQLAEAAGFVLDRESTRAAQPDNLGCIFVLYAETLDAVPEVAERLVREHMEWALKPLKVASEGEGFYAQLARAAARLIAELTQG